MTGVIPNAQAYGALTGDIHGYKCPRCQKSWGYLFMEKTGAMYFCGEKLCLKNDSEASLSIERSKQKTNERDAAREFSIGSNYVNASLSKWMTKQANIDIVGAWVKNPSKFLVYGGVPGSGKTYFCTAIANFLFTMKREPRYIHTRDFLANCKKTIDQAGQNPSDYVKSLCTCDVLILDDLGSTMNTEYQKELILELVDIRYSNNAPTVITTNYNRNSLTDCLGERITRRVFDDSKIIVKEDKYAK